MNNIGKYCLGGLVLAVVGFLGWYFSSIIAYILVAVIISFLGRPVMNLMEKLEIKGYHIPGGLRAAIALICIWVVFVLFFYSVIPLVSQEFQSLSDISITNIVNKLEDPLADLEQGLKRFGILEAHQDIKEYIVKNLKSVVDVTQIQNIFGSLAGTISSIFIALFSVTFMAFFFLKDSKLFYRMLLTVVPTRYGEGVGTTVSNIR